MILTTGKNFSIYMHIWDGRREYRFGVEEATLDSVDRHGWLLFEQNGAILTVVIGVFL